MVRPKPSVLYAHTFVHPQLDEYVDEMLFSEPVYITACEFLEQNASSLCPAVKLMGATSPPSFALEVFIHCEGEAKFRRLCLPCLYSQSSSNVLDVEAVVTNHLVVRGSYRSLSMVVYGNTAEDLGQLNIDVGLDSSFTDTVSAVEGDLEDLPPAFRPTKLAIEEFVSPLKLLSPAAVALDLRFEVRQIIQLAFISLDSQDLGVAADNVIRSLLSVASTYTMLSASQKVIDPKLRGLDALINSGGPDHVLTEARKVLLLCDKRLQSQSGDLSESSVESLFFESAAVAPTSKELVDAVHHRYDFVSSARIVGYPHLSQHKNTIIWLSMAHLLCSARESCFHFVKSGGMKQLGYAFTHCLQNSTSLTLLLLGVIEQATRFSIGCEGFLGWWPREDDTVPSGISEGYNQLLKLLLENQRHDVSFVATDILHRLRMYEVASRYEYAVLSVLGATPTSGRAANFTLDMLANAKVQLKKVLKLLKLCGPIDDPSLMTAARRFHIHSDAGLLAYTTTSDLINLSNCCFSNWDIDSHLLSLLKERGFLPLSAALLSSSILQSGKGHEIDLFVDIVLCINAIILSLLFCRSGLDFVLHDPEVWSTIVCSLRGIDDVQKETPISLRYASILTSKGFFCHPREVGMIIEMHASALIAIDSLCKLTPDTEEFLWVLWDLCRLSRSECGRQALLVLAYIPEALAVLVSALHSGKELDPVSSNTGVSPLSLAVFHSAAEIFEVIVTDSTATSLSSWVDGAKELHMALHSSSPGSTKKDAPARLLEWIDASVVYHRNGATGVLRYAAVLASGGDAQMVSNSVLASDMMDVDNVVGDSSSGPDGNVVDNLIGKRITEKDFPADILRESSIAQLTTAFRILAFISDDSVVAAALYDEGAVMVIHGVMINCKLMLEKPSDIHGVFLDEGTEVNSTSNFLQERKLEKSLIDLLIPALVLLINLLQKLEEAKEQHRNTKLMSTLLQLHREVSPKLAACASVVSKSCPDLELGFGTVCHLLSSALACWPVYNWTPGLFHFLLDSFNATSLLALGPKETCSLLCLLNYLFPEESIWLWKNGMPMLTALRAVAVGTLLGSQKEEQISWYLRTGHPEKLVAQLSPHLAKLGEIVLHCAISVSVVIQDMLRVFIIRIACLNIDSASSLLKPIIVWISNCLSLSEPSALSEIDAYKVQQLLNFLSILFEHPMAKPLFLKDGGIQMLTKVLERCILASNYNEKQFTENTNLPKDEVPLLSWCAPLFKSISLITDTQACLQRSGVYHRNASEKCTTEEYSIFWTYLLRHCTVLPIGKELLACLSALREMGSSTEGQHALLSIYMHIAPSTVDSETPMNQETDARGNIANASEWKEYPPLLCCWTNLIRSIDRNNVPVVQVAEAIHILASGALGFCVDGESLNMNRVAVIKFLFGVKNENSIKNIVEESLETIEELTSLLGPETIIHSACDTLLTSSQVKESANLLLILLQKSSGTDEVDATISSGYTSLLTPLFSSRIHKIADRSMERLEDQNLDEFGAKFSWECPEKQAQAGSKRKSFSLEGANRRARGDNLFLEATGQSSFSKGSVPVTTPSSLTRRDNFRQRKPNTSRPPSMHVDDYVARERNTDVTNNTSHVIAVQRIGSSSGRPPSIHVDEFMARQRDRRNVVGPGGTPDAATQAKTTVSDNNNAGAGKSTETRQVKPDLDDDLQGIDIVFDAEESEPDDKLPFPQPDYNLQQPASVVVEQQSPHSVVEETESESNQFSRFGTPLASIMDENTPEIPLKREPSISSDKKFSDQLEGSKSFPLRNPSAIDPNAVSEYMNNQSIRYQTPPNLYYKANLQQSGAVSSGTWSHGFHNQKFSLNQPPLPLTPLPQTVSTMLSQNMDPVMSQSFPTGFHVQSEYTSLVPSSSTPLASSIALQDPKFGWTSLSSPGGSTRPPPPLPPTPPPYSANSSPLSSLKNFTSLSPQYFQTEIQQTSVSASLSLLSSYPTAPLMQPMLFRPGSVPVNLYGNRLSQHHPENLSNFSQNLPQYQPPQIPRPPPQHLRPPVPASPQSELHMPTQVLQQPQVSPAHVYYQTQQQENLSHSLQQQIDHSRNLHMSGIGTSQQQDPAMSLQEYFKSPEAIQSLLSDRDKLCQLLEQHPKLMQMLQERLGHL